MVGLRILAILLLIKLIELERKKNH